MSTFDLSLAIPAPVNSEVKASLTRDQNVDKDTGEVTPKEATDSGITVDKSKAPALVLDGPLGHTYTQLLDRELTIEAMGAVVAASSLRNEEADASISKSKTGMLVQGPDGPVLEHGTDDGYLYIANADTLESSDLGTISKRVIDHQLKNPNGNITVGLVSEGKPSPTLEKIVDCLSPMGVKFTYTREGVISAAKRVLKVD